ncbi:hypothetical protein AVL50_32195 [Flammeovirga sp. SJP92]|nr:hypothetical protein AVL50_32195 [Flammeovirga sp. SJP92]
MHQSEEYKNIISFTYKYALMKKIKHLLHTIQSLVKRSKRVNNKKPPVPIHKIQTTLFICCGNRRSNSLYDLIQDYNFKVLDYSPVNKIRFIITLNDFVELIEKIKSENFNVIVDNESSYIA